MTHCNTLQHAATHCNTMQHAVTLCNTLTYTYQHEMADDTHDEMLNFEWSSTPYTGYAHTPHTHNTHTQHTAHTHHTHNTYTTDWICTTVSCCSLQLVAVLSNVLQCVTMFCSSLGMRFCMLPCNQRVVESCCSASQCIARIVLSRQFSGGRSTIGLVHPRYPVVVQCVAV